ncbi:L,D-transpeptidase family protein [Xylocopilactobacillus apicola]|nr:L,D-transpeptidase family protein [Xylocopilactobacillus apicola]
METKIQRPKVNSKKQGFKKGSFFLISIFGIIIVSTFYLLYSLNFQNNFMPNTQAFGVDISNKDVNEAADLLHSKLDNMEFKIYEDSSVVYTITSKEIDLKKDYHPFLKDLMKRQNPALWGVKTLAFASNNDEHSNDIKLTINNESLKRIEDKLKTNLSKDRSAPVDAKIIRDGDEYKLVKEIDGNTISFAKLENKIRNNINNANAKITIEKDDYEQPKIRENNSTLQKNFKQIQLIQGTKITYQVANSATIEVPKSDITNWINYDNNQVDLNTQSIYNYISNINGNYSTVGITRNFKTSDGAMIKVSGGTYGRQIKVNDDTAQFKNALLKGATTKITASVIGQGLDEANPDNIGNTYVEVSKAKQHEWVYVDGKLFIDANIVTGKPNKKNDTPTGTFVIWNKQSPSVLKGFNDDGSRYSSPVTYWMPIDYTGVGLHDSPWQPKYGGDWYVNNGSHGCINNPPDVIAKYYPVLKIGTPVIIY